jgi:hypothetical protein
MPRLTLRLQADAQAHAARLTTLTLDEEGHE